MADDDGKALNELFSPEELCAQGFLVRLPDEVEVVGHDHARAVYIALQPLTVEGSDRVAHRLHVGDLLSADEAVHAGSGLRRLVLAGAVAELSVEHGLPALWRIECEHAARLEAELAASGKAA